MDIFAYALQMEKDGERFYREIASQTDDPGIKTIVTMLADEEVKHYEAIEGMRQGHSDLMAETRILDEARNIFVQMKEEGREPAADTDQIQLYEKAQQIEKRSQQFYQEKADQSDKDDQKRLFGQLAAEEEKHYRLLESIVAFVSKPKQWLENAEWHHLEEY